MSRRLDTAISVLLAGAACLVAVSFAYRTFVRPSPPPGLYTPARKLESSEWNAAVAASVSLHGDASAPVTLIEFADLECPACAAYQSVIDEVVAKHGGSLRVAMVHFPLRRHRFAMPAARALECADSVGAAAAFARTAYAHQDSMGILSWATIAHRAGIADTTLIQACASSTELRARIETGRNLSSTLQLSGTPTVFINRWHFGVPNAAVLDSVISSMLSKGER